MQLDQIPNITFKAGASDKRAVTIYYTCKYKLNSQLLGARYQENYLRETR